MISLVFQIAGARDVQELNDSDKEEVGIAIAKSGLTAVPSVSIVYLHASYSVAYTNHVIHPFLLGKLTYCSQNLHALILACFFSFFIKEKYCFLISFYLSFRMITR